MSCIYSWAAARPPPQAVSGTVFSQGFFEPLPMEDLAGPRLLSTPSRNGARPSGCPLR